ncbi:MAG: arginine--tRNA ligase [Candidatus Pacebacteria bacterium]|nr:arginine--tRNA ligase [Candidatus Paceibacterota bacterium]
MINSHILARLLGQIFRALEQLEAKGEIPRGLKFTRVTVDPPRDLSHGELATNAAMVLAKEARLKPQELAHKIGQALTALPPESEDVTIQSWSVEGPGFLNFRLAPAVWQAELHRALALESRFGASEIGRGQRVNVEYVSANPTGPLHLAHARGAVVGDALAALLEFTGHKVCREYYINDAGAQVEVLARSLYHRYRQAAGEDIGEVPAGLYPGDYLRPIAADLYAKTGAAWQNRDEAEWLPFFMATAIAAMLNMIKTDLAQLGIKHDVFASEDQLVKAGAVARVLESLTQMGLIYQGHLEAPKAGKAAESHEDWEDRPQTLFRSTEFGDDSDRALLKSNGSYTYFANDIAYHLDKIDRGFTQLINIWGADHGGYVKRMAAAVKALSQGQVTLDVKLCQLVTLLDNGIPVKMSKRAGTFVTLAEVVEQVGAGVVRFIMLTRKNDMALEFDLAKVVEQSRDNPVFYVQYGHARAASVLRMAREGAGDGKPAYDLSPQTLLTTDLSGLTSEEELSLIRLLAFWPRLVEQASEAHEPHRIAFYLGEVAAAFHSLWTKGRENATIRFIQPEDQKGTSARLTLVAATKLTLSVGLRILGVEPIEEMR